MKHGMKIAAVIAIGAFFVLYFVLYMLVAFLAPDMPMIARIAVGGFGAFSAGYMIETMIERIMEIRKGEDDDLSNY
jgi:hypothetical protein